MLAELRDGVLELNLLGRGAHRRYDIRVRIPDEEELRRIDEAFRNHLARNDVSVSDVRRFDEAFSVGAGAKDYAASLADYVYGILAKDSAGSTTLPPKEFPKKLKRALEVLLGFERPLAMAIASCVRFNFNDFRSSWKPCGVPMLDCAFQFFRQRALGQSDGTRFSPRQTVSNLVPLCPLDNVTHKIMKLVSTPGPISDLRDFTLRYDLSDEDRVKLYVLLAAQVADRTSEDVRACHDSLERDPVFGRWAASALEGAR